MYVIGRQIIEIQNVYLIIKNKQRKKKLVRFPIQFLQNRTLLIIHAYVYIYYILLKYIDACSHRADHEALFMYGYGKYRF